MFRRACSRARSASYSVGYGAKTSANDVGRIGTNRGVMDNARGAGARAYAAEGANAPPPLVVCMTGVRRPLNSIHKMIESTGAEIKESRNVSLGGRSSHMFLVTGADPMKLKREFEKENTDFFSVFEARNTVRDIKGPYCATSPLLPYVRKATMHVPYKPGVVGEIAEFLCSKGVTVNHLDEYRSGKDVVLEAMLHMPTGLAEFPVVEESYILRKLEALGVTVREFGKIEGRPKEKAAA